MDGDLWAVDMPVLSDVRLQYLNLGINGIYYTFDLAKAKVTRGAAFTYYEITVPDDWDPQSRTIP